MCFKIQKGFQQFPINIFWSDIYMNIEYKESFDGNETSTTGKENNIRHNNYIEKLMMWCFNHKSKTSGKQSGYSGAPALDRMIIIQRVMARESSLIIIIITNNQIRVALRR